MIDWTRITQEQFDRAIECLLEDVWTDVENTTFTVTDGRGGDGGIDALVRTPTETIIYQLKFWPNGFRESGSSRKTQVKRSFRRAMSHNPDRWVLVVPCLLTAAQRDWVHDLGTGKNVVVEIMDRPVLDRLVARNPNVERYLNRNILLDDVKDQQILTAAVSSINDLMSKHQLLASKASEMDLYWEPVISEINGIQTVSVKPKTPDAHTRSPIVFKVETTGELSETQHNMIDRVLKYGAPGMAEFDANITLKSGPSFLMDDGPAFVRFGADQVESVSIPVCVEIENSENKIFSEHYGILIERSHGTNGGYLKFEFYNTLELEMLLDNSGTGGKLNIHLESNGRLPRDVADAVDLEETLLNVPPVIRFRFEDMNPITFRLNPESRQSGPDLATLHQIADDYDVVQRHVRRRIPMPEAWSDGERLLLRIARLLIDGKTVMLPPWMSMHLSLRDDLTTDEQKEVLETFSTPSGFYRVHPNLPLEIADQIFDIGPNVLGSKEVEVTDSEQLFARLAAGDGAGAEVELVAKQGSPFLVTCATTELGEVNWTPVPWQAVGLDEHPDFQKSSG